MILLNNCGIQVKENFKVKDLEDLQPRGRGFESLLCILQ